MFTPLTLFLLIGISHYAQHVIQCQECRHQYANLMIMFGEAIIHIFGWPMMLIQFISAQLLMWKHGPQFETKQFATAEISMGNDSKPFWLTQTEGETLPEFKARAMRAIEEEKAKFLKAQSEKRNLQ